MATGDIYYGYRCAVPESDDEKSPHGLVLFDGPVFGAYSTVAETSEPLDVYERQCPPFRILRNT